MYKESNTAKSFMRFEGKYDLVVYISMEDVAAFYKYTDDEVVLKLSSGYDIHVTMESFEKHFKGYL